MLFVGCITLTGSASAQNRSMIVFLYDISESYRPGPAGFDSFRSAVEEILGRVDSVQTVAFALIGNCECGCYCRGRQVRPDRPCTPPIIIPHAPSAPGDWNDADSAINLRNSYYDDFLDRVKRWESENPGNSKATDIKGGLCKAAELFRLAKNARRYLVILSDLHDEASEGCPALSFDSGGLRGVRALLCRHSRVAASAL